MLTERSIINFLIWTGGLVIGPYMAGEAIYGNFIPLLTGVAVVLVVCIFGYWQDRMCLVPFIAIYCPGRFNFIPFQLGPTDLAALALVFYYLIRYTALKRQSMRMGPLFFFIPIVVFAVIILQDEPNLGLRALSDTREGGRGSLLILLSAVTYVCGVSMNSPSPRFLSRLPMVCTIVMAIFSLPYILTTLFPALSPYLYLISDDINITAYESDVLNSGGVVRNENLALFGTLLMSSLLAYFPVTTWWRPSRWVFVLVALLCCGLVLVGGFRNLTAVLALVVLTSTWCYIGWRALAVVPILGVGLALLLVAQQSHSIQLPSAVQRTLAFLPGDWDPDILENTEASNDFRTGIIQVYLKENARLHPWLGNGLSYDAAEFALCVYMAEYHETADNYWLYKEFITDKVFHTGWVSMYDSVGLIGSTFFVFLCLAQIYVTGRDALSKSANKSSLFYPLKVWLFATTVTRVVTFFTLYGDIKQTFPALCYVAILWYHLDRVEKLGLGQGAIRPREVLFKGNSSGVLVTS